MLFIYIEAAFIVLQIMILYSITQYEQQKRTGLDNHSLLSNTFYCITCITVIMYACESKKKKTTRRQVIIFHNHDCLILQCEGD